MPKLLTCEAGASIKPGVERNATPETMPPNKQARKASDSMYNTARLKPNGCRPLHGLAQFVCPGVTR
jgi:hypothetical protein